MNHVIISGMLGRDPRTGVTASGTVWANASVAVQKYRQKDKTYETHWIKVVAWSRSADILSTFVKGELVIIEGELSTSEYEKDGKKQYSTEVMAHSVIKGVKLERLTQNQDQAQEGVGAP